MPAQRSTKQKKVTFNFSYQKVQKNLFHYTSRNEGTYLELVAPQVVEIGGVHSGKTIGKLMFFVQNYCLRFPHCDILILRRTFSELESGVIQDFKTFVPSDLYQYNQQNHIATFTNGSRCVFGGCVNNKERDIEKYLGQRYPGILVDECGQFSPDAWNLLVARNSVNAACEPDQFGNFPTPQIAGCTNPLGAFWTFYHTVFVLREPWEKEEGCRKAKDGSWWAPDGGDWRCIYDPRNYAFNHTTVLDNPEYLKRDPGEIARLKSLPKGKMQKMLLGLMDKVEGQYFDCFSEEQHVVDLREDPEAIIWEDWQPVWAGQDFGVGHWNAIYMFTMAKVRKSVGEDYKSKVVCFQEIAPDQTGQSDLELANMLEVKAHYPRLPEDHSQFSRVSGKRCKLRAIYFSHEKFNRQMTAHSPAVEYSRLLQARGLPAVTRATTDRVGSASFLYNLFKHGRIAILRTCQGIINALPALQRDPNNLDDVLKVDSKSDDRYDAFRYGLFGMLNQKAKPQEERDREYADKLDPLSKHFYMMKAKANAQKRTESFSQEPASAWEYRQ